MMRLRHSASPRVPSSDFARFRAIFYAALLCFAGIVPAHAAGKIFTIDTFQVFSDSSLGKDIADKLEKMAEERTSIIRPALEALDAEKQSLEAQISILSKEELKKNSKLQDRVTSFQNRYRDFEMRKRRIAQELELTRDGAAEKFNTALRPIMEKLARDLKADLIVDRRSVLYSADSIDVTDKIIVLLNKSQQDVGIEWVSLDNMQEPQ